MLFGVWVVCGLLFMVWVFGVLFKGYFVYGCELELGKTLKINN
jgi:hypothetical protein